MHSALHAYCVLVDTNFTLLCRSLAELVGALLTLAVCVAPPYFVGRELWKVIVHVVGARRLKAVGEGAFVLYGLACVGGVIVALVYMGFLMWPLVAVGTLVFLVISWQGKARAGRE